MIGRKQGKEIYVNTFTYLKPMFLLSDSFVKGGGMSRSRRGIGLFKEPPHLGLRCRPSHSDPMSLCLSLNSIHLVNVRCDWEKGRGGEGGRHHMRARGQCKRKRSYGLPGARPMDINCFRKSAFEEAISPTYPTN